MNDPDVRALADVDPAGRNPWRTVPPLCLGFFMIMLDTTIVNIAIPSLQRALDADLVAVGWVNSAYLLGFASLLLAAGRLGDRLGPKRVFVTGLVVFVLASGVCGLAGSIDHLIVARAVQGVGAALMTPQTMAIITRVFPPLKRGAALGVWGATAGVATIAGPLLGGVLVQSWGWEWIFMINVPVGIVALWLALRELPRLETHHRTTDVLGAVLSVVGLGAFVFGVQEGQGYDWGTIVGPVSVWGLIALGLGVLIVFLLRQRRLGADALLPLHLFSVRSFTLANVAGAMVSFAMLGMFFPFTLFLQQVQGYTPLRAALFFLPSSLVSGVVAPLAGRLSDRLPAKWLVSTGFALIATAVGWLVLVIAPHTPAPYILAAMAVFGVGTGMLFAPLANSATRGLDQRTAGAGAGAFNATRQVGGVIGSAAIVALLTARLAVTIPEAVGRVTSHLPADLAGLVGKAFADGGPGAPLPDGVPPDVGAAIEEAVRTGFATAVSQTMMLTVAVLLVGLVCGLAMRPERSGQREDVVDG